MNAHSQSTGRLVPLVVLGLLVLLAALVQAPAASATASTVSPSSITLGDGDGVCDGGSASTPVSVEVTLPPDAAFSDVDVFLLFDDTGSFASVAPSIKALFPTLVTDLETALPSIEFGFGVGRFEEYGSFAGENTTGRPFILGQPIITAADAGSAATRDGLIDDALGNTPPGFGGDGPETAIEGLWQLATGLGFDGNGDGDTTDSGPAGAEATQISPGSSGDVPAFSTNVLPTSGALGGGGFRSGAFKIVLVATDISTVSPFSGAAVPTDVVSPFSTEPSTAFSSGGSRHGLVGPPVAPLGAATVQETVDALTDLGLQVIGLSTDGGPTTAPGPSFYDSTIFLSALARLTGAVDDLGTALVFPTSTTSTDISAAIEEAVTTATTGDVTVELVAPGMPAGLSLGVSPASVASVSPGESASFTATFSGDGSDIVGTFDLIARDVDSGGEIGSIPVDIDCTPVGDVFECLASITPSDALAAGFNVIEGTSAKDVLNGTGGPDAIFGLAGNDTINGRGGDDCIIAGPGNDYVNAGGGDDVVLGNAGSDKLEGRGGDDVLKGGGGSFSILIGGSGFDTCSSSATNNSFSGCDA